MAGSLPNLHQGRGKPQKLLSGGRQGHPGLVAQEDRSPELVLKRTDTGADGGLGHVQPLGGADEASGFNNSEKSTGEFDVHGDILYGPGNAWD
jgi:hypothetical protein